MMVYTPLMLVLSLLPIVTEPWLWIKVGIVVVGTIIFAFGRPDSRCGNGMNTGVNAARTRNIRNTLARWTTVAEGQRARGSDGRSQPAYPREGQLQRYGPHGDPSVRSHQGPKMNDDPNSEL